MELVDKQAQHSLSTKVTFILNVHCSTVTHTQHTQKGLDPRYTHPFTYTCPRLYQSCCHKWSGLKGSTGGSVVLHVELVAINWNLRPSCLDITTISAASREPEENARGNSCGFCTCSRLSVPSDPNTIQQEKSQRRGCRRGHAGVRRVRGYERIFGGLLEFRFQWV